MSERFLSARSTGAADDDRASRSTQAMVIWLVGLTVYFVAVLQRSSLAVAGLLAAERFDITASQLSTFVVLQLLVYALMQVPVGSWSIGSVRVAYCSPGR